MNKYNDGLNNDTEIYVISSFRRPHSEKTKAILSDMGTLKTTECDVMYSDKSNLNLNLNLNTLHQDDNVAGCAREIPSEAFGLEVREEPEDHRSKIGNASIRDLTSDLLITQIEVQMGKIKQGRHNRADVYVSLMTIDDKLYTIKLTSDITNAYSEVKRSCRKSVYWSEKIEELIKMNLANLMIGRARYKATSHRPLWQTKPNLGNVLIAYCTENDIPTIILYLFTDEPIIIPLDKPLSTSQQKYYQFAGVWCKEMEDL